MSGSAVRINVIVEGESEEAFVKDILYPHFIKARVFLNPILAPNKWRATARINRGGGNSFRAALDSIVRKLREDTTAYCTTLFDYYKLAPDFPGHSHDDLPPAIRLYDRIALPEWVTNA